MFHNPEDVRWFKVRESICIYKMYVCVCVDLVYIHHDWVFLCNFIFLHGCWILQPVEVWTKCGRRGRIKEPVGTHGMVLIVTR